MVKNIPKLFSIYFEVFALHRAPDLASLGTIVQVALTVLVAVLIGHAV